MLHLCENPLFMTSFYASKPVWPRQLTSHSSPDHPLSQVVLISHESLRACVTPCALICHTVERSCCCVYKSIACFHLRKKKLFIWWYDGGVFLVLESHFCAMGCFGNNITDEEQETNRRQKKTNQKIEKQLRDDKIAYRATHRLLLLGNNFSSCMAVLLGFEGG